MPTSTAYKIKVCLVGEAAVGKTSLIRRFVVDQFDDRYTSTLGARTTKAEIVVEDPETGEAVGVAMLIWDLMGERHVPESLLQAYFRGTQGVLAVCDVLRFSTIEQLRDWVQSVYSVAGALPTTCAVNKADLLREAEAIYEGINLNARIASLGAPHFLTSAKTGENVRTISPPPRRKRSPTAPLRESSFAPSLVFSRRRGRTAKNRTLGTLLVKQSSP